MAKVAIVLSVFLLGCSTHLLNKRQAGILDLMWTAAGPLEIAVCFEAKERRDGSWKVTNLVLPPQQGDSISVMFSCEGYPGWGHNHALLGGVYGGVHLCEMSNLDVATTVGMRAFFHVLWCGPGNLKADLFTAPERGLRLNVRDVGSPPD